MTVPNNDATYREMLASGRFYYGAEVVTSRGPQPVDSPGNPASFAKDLLADPRIGWISITDNPGGGPMLPPDWLAGLVAEHRNRVVIHLACKDLNRSGLESAAWRYASEGFDNILALTGDYPTGGFGGLAEPVFDIDSIGLIDLLRSMNEGLSVPGRGGKIETLPKTDFFIGCAVSPFKRHERELLPQYFKLVRKIAAGAQWVIPQLGYDMRKFHEIKLFLDTRGIDAPIVGNVYLLTKGVAKLFNSGKLAGCVVSNELLRKIEKYAAGPDKGKQFCRELAAKQLAVFKGLGFAAGYIGGVHKADGFGPIIELAESYGPDDWRDFLKEIQYSQFEEFFLFEHDKFTGLCEAGRINRDYLASLKRPAKSKEVNLHYKLSRWVHGLAFTRDRALYPLLKRIYARWDRKPGFLGRMAYRVEKASKLAMYGCQDCGDCSLPDCAYICPKKWCSKCQRNGPCGGSIDGRCELEDKECLWARVYERLKFYGESETMLDRPTVFYDAKLKETSSWANTYLDRDHNAPKRD
ncbi:MAG: methylenetetrahydrofolate reductase C-terminal domain-containing protein [Planctomycetes bacterium]|nr:methylenetetrahydrofolate reductase C-terminal domain-containing protein [Planctomycetota bacterium]MBU4398192.1 methylenetetrahydrofolate reductase C-terminal domain-containing protein [Planctomycetota bacterium]MCG2685676.1 methylenetetrahydrofolate reductase C-terminal domain-containing protein [Planctomycetales bacterium]